MHQNVTKPTFQNELGMETNILYLVLTDSGNRLYMMEHSPPLGGIEHGHHVLEFKYIFCNSKKENELLKKTEIFTQKRELRGFKRIFQ
jgi:hypothetical protein